MMRFRSHSENLKLSGAPDGGYPRNPIHAIEGRLWGEELGGGRGWVGGGVWGGGWGVGGGRGLGLGGGGHTRKTGAIWQICVQQQNFRPFHATFSVKSLVKFCANCSHKRFCEVFFAFFCTKIGVFFFFNFGHDKVSQHPALKTQEFARFPSQSVYLPVFP